MARKPKSSAPAPAAVASAATPADVAPVAAVPRTLSLGPALTISAAESLRRELLALVEAGGDVSLDGNAVEAVDTAGMQVLVAFCRALQKGNRKLAWSGCSPVLMDISGLLGLQAQIGVTA